MFLFYLSQNEMNFFILLACSWTRKEGTQTLQYSGCHVFASLCHWILEPVLDKKFIYIRVRRMSLSGNGIPLLGTASSIAFVSLHQVSLYVYIFSL